MDSETNSQNHATVDLTGISFSDIFNLAEIQRLQDLFSDATGIASLITHPDGTPITSPSNFCRLCNDIIRKTERGSANCLKSDLHICGLSVSGLVTKACLSAGLWDAGASISVNGQHIATWLIGQVRNAETDEEKMRKYADEIGADRDEFMLAFSEVPIMSEEQFKKVAKMLFAFTNELSEKAYANLQLKNQIAQQQETTARLYESEERFQALFEAAPDAIFLADPVSKKILDVNKNACLLLGREREAIKKMYQHQLHPGDQDIYSKDTFNDHIIQSEERGFTHPVENMVVRSDGDLIPVEILAQLVRINDQKMIMGTFRDISERKVAEKRLKESEEKHRILFMNSPDSYLIIVDGVIIDCNSATEHMLGGERKHIIGCTPQALSPEFQSNGQSSSEAAKERLKQAKEKGSATFEWVHRRFDGSEFSVEVSIAFIALEGKPALFTTWRDISARKQAENALKESEIKYRELVENSPDAFVVYQEGKIVFANKASFSLIGAKHADELLGKPVMQFVDPESRAMVAERMRVTVNEGTVLPLAEERFIRIDGSGLDVEVKGMRIALNNKPAVQLIIRDISEKKQAEVALRKNEERYRALVDNVFEGILIINLEGNILFANQSLIKTFEYENLEELVGGNVFQYIAPESIPQAIADLTGVAEGLEVDVANYAGITSKGNKIWFESIGKIIEYEGVVADIISVRDVTAKKLADAKLAENESRFKAITETANDAILVTNNNGLIVFSNPRAHQIFGYDENEFAGLTLEMLMPEKYRDLHKTNFEAFVAGGNAYFIGKTTEFSAIRKNGSEFTMEISLSKWETSSGVFVAANIRDITDRELVVEALKKSESFLKEAQIIANLGLYTLDFATGNWESSEVLDKIFGIDADYERSVDGWESIVHPEWRKFMDKYFKEEVVGSRTDFDKEYKIIRKIDQEERWVHGMGRLKFDEENRLTHMVGTIRDITERKNTEQELITARDRAEESDRLKSAFLANMSHEIRTPMNGILGFAELLKMPGLSGEQQQEFIRIIRKSGHRMLNIINDIVDISKIESGQMKVLISDTNINDQIDYIYAFFKPEAENKGIQLFFKNGLASEQSIIKTDQEKVYAILTNLVKNAIKYTNEGTIEFGYIPAGSVVKLYAKANENETTEASDPTDPGDLYTAVTEPAELQFYVKDTGIGIPFDRQKAIFDRFVQADIADTRAYQGAGLGLSITKAFVEMLGGRLWVESQLFKGSTFYFTIPFHRVADETIARKKDLPAGEEMLRTQQLKILIAEDDETSVFFLVVALKDITKMVLKAKTGTEAVAACRNNPDIDLILMDIKMPLMDGYEATRQIRQFNKDVIIIAQTAFALSGDREKAIKAGCNDYITKPMNDAFLKDLIQKYFSG